MIWRLLFALARTLFRYKPKPLPQEPKAPQMPIPQPPPPPIKKKHQQRYCWLLDNGHGKATPGKLSAMLPVGTRLLEYEFNRDIVKRIAAGLKAKEIAYHIVVPEVDCGDWLRERVQRANTYKSSLPKIFVSVHANAFKRPWSLPSGVEVWHKYGDTVSTILADIFQQKIIAATGWLNRGIKSRKEKQFYVLKHTTMPAILTENGFYTNIKEVKDLLRDEVRQSIAEAHIQAIEEIETSISFVPSKKSVTWKSILKRK